MTLWLRLARIPLLVALLVATAWPYRELSQAVARTDFSSYYPAWAQMAAVGLAFVAVMLLGRNRVPFRLVLVTEGVVAVALALVPPASWVWWFGIGWFGQAAIAGFMQPLAMAWLGVVIASAVWHRGDYRELRGGPTSGNPGQ